MTVTTSGVPDLLQRFVETPFSATITGDGAEITLQSNVEVADIDKHLAPTADDPIDKLCATIVQDFEAPDDGDDIIVIKAWPVATVLVGTGTVLVLDCERSQIFGFLAPAVGATRFVNELLPILVNLYRELKSKAKLQEHSFAHE